MPKRIFSAGFERRGLRLSIGAKTLLAFLVIITVLAGGFYYFATRTLSSEIKVEALHELESKMQGAWRLYHARLDQMKYGMLQAASGEAMKEAVRKKDAAYLKDSIERYSAVRPYVDLWAIVGDDLRVITRKDAPGGDLFELGGVVSRALSTGEPVLSTESVSRDLLLREGARLREKAPEANGLMQVAAVPVMHKGKAVGAIVTGILMNGNGWLPNGIYENFEVSSALFAFDGQKMKTAALDSGNRGVFSAVTVLPEDVAASIEKGSFLGRTTLDGMDVFLAIGPIHNLDGRVIGGLGVASLGAHVQHHVNHLSRQIGFVAAAGLVCSLIFAFFVYRDTTKPIKAVRSAMEETASGNLEVEVDIRTKDEFEYIGNGFNRMMEAIRVREARLDRFNQLSQVLIQHNDPQALLNRALNTIVELTESHIGVIYLLDHSSDVLRPEVFSGTESGELKKLKKGEGLAGRCAAELKTFVLQDLSDSELMLEAGLLKVRPAGLVWFPLSYKEKAQGVLVLGSLKPYDHDEVKHIEHLVTQVSIALDNAFVHKEIEKLSVTDPLTGVLNRRKFVEIAEDEFKAARRYRYNLGILMIDADDFKQVNDTLGHQQGDVVLTELSALIKEKTRVTDVWARYGGEEFIGLVTHCGLDGMHILAEKIRKAVEEHQFPGMKGRKVTVSIGIGYFPSEDVKDTEDLIRIADENLYKAKRGGKNLTVMSNMPQAELAEGA